jgi:hypothetical protein
MVIHLHRPRANAVGGVTYCEQNGGAILRCTPTTAGPLRLEVDGVGGNAYAVWRIELPEVTANAEDFQALGLRVRNMQGVLPYLYLIDQNGVRAYVSLLDYLIRPPDAPSSDWLDVIVPFVWFADGEGRRPDIRRLAEFQIVFQWQAMAGTLEVDDVRFIHHVQWPLAGDTIVPATVQLPPGFEATVYAGASGLGSATTITWGPDGHLWLSQENGNIWKIADTDGDGRADKAFLTAWPGALMAGSTFPWDRPGMLPPKPNRWRHRSCACLISAVGPISRWWPPASAILMT